MKVKSEREVAQSRLTLIDPMDCSLQGSSIHGIFQARVLEWGAIAFSDRGLRRRQILKASTEQEGPSVVPTGKPGCLCDRFQSYLHHISGDISLVTSYPKVEINSPKDAMKFR